MLNQISPTVIQNGTLSLLDCDVAFVKPPVYEVIRVIDGTPLFFDGHCERLFKSLELMNFKHTLDRATLLKGIETLVEETKIVNNNIRLEVGYMDNGELVWVLFWVKSTYPEQTIYEKGVKTVTAQVTRENPHAKIFRSAFADFINTLKRDTDAFEVILINSEGIVTEGSRSNLFFIKGNTICTAMEKDVLMGITRQKLMALINTLQIEVVQMDISLSDIASFDACFLTGTSIHILPINQIDQLNFNSSENPKIKELQKAFANVVTEDIKNTRRSPQW